MNQDPCIFAKNLRTCLKTWQKETSARRVKCGLKLFQQLLMLIATSLLNSLYTSHLKLKISNLRP